MREPLRGFLSNNASAKEKQRFSKLAMKRRAPGAQVSDTDLMVVVPAFLVTELLEAFTLGFAIYLPFLVIDLVVANVLVGLGMQMMNPNQISLPFKLLLFVAADGWGLLAEVLVDGLLPLSAMGRPGFARTPLAIAAPLESGCPVEWKVNRTRAGLSASVPRKRRAG